MCGCGPSTGEQETSGSLGLASKLVWLNQWIPDSVRDLFKIRQWETEEDIGCPPPQVSRAHTQMRDFKNFFHELEFLCLRVCVCEEWVGVGARHSWGGQRTWCGVYSSLPSLCGLWGLNTGHQACQASSLNQWAILPALIIDILCRVLWVCWLFLVLTLWIVLGRYSTHYGSGLECIPRVVWPWLPFHNVLIIPPKEYVPLHFPPPISKL